MKSEHWTDRLSEFLDGELDAAERSACEAHLEACSSCAETLEDLTALVARAAILPEVPPSRDLWPDIEQRLPPRSREAESTARERPDRDVIPFRRRRVSFTVPQLAAAAIALLLMSAGSVWMALPRAGGDLTFAGEPAAVVTLASSYDGAIQDLQAEFERRREELDPETVRVVEENLAIIDAAISEARAALGDDPASGFLQAHLASTLRQKIDLLRQVATIDQTEI